MALLNYGVTRSPFLAACLREICFYLARYNIELRAEYIPSRDNSMADLCSRAFNDDLNYNKFKILLNEKVLVLDNIFYEKFEFQLDV